MTRSGASFWTDRRLLLRCILTLESTGTCPYYASRAAVKSAELVTIPYNSLVHKVSGPPPPYPRTRAACNPCICLLAWDR
ncbi:MAG: hypothetical protein ACPIOQ_38775 [Promethearchaeia archaeon]